MCLLMYILNFQSLIKVLKLVSEQSINSIMYGAMIKKNIFLFQWPYSPKRG